MTVSMLIALLRSHKPSLTSSAAEKALRSLPSPLTASDEHVYARPTTTEVVSITAGLHRQVWISGNCLFVDVHITNRSHKMLKKLELSIERDVLCYNHVSKPAQSRTRL